MFDFNHIPYTEAIAQIESALDKHDLSKILSFYSGKHFQAYEILDTVSHEFPDTEEYLDWFADCEFVDYCRKKYPDFQWTHILIGNDGDETFILR